MAARSRKANQQAGEQQSKPNQKTKKRNAGKGFLERYGTCCRVMISLLVILVLYIVFWPTEVDPIAIEEDPPMPMEGTLSPDRHSLVGQKIYFPDLLHGPEAFAFDEDGYIYTGTNNGAIWKWDGKSSSKPTVFATTGSKTCEINSTLEQECGRPLGLRVVGDRLVVADALQGLLEIDLESGAKHTLVPYRSEIEGVPFAFPDDVVLAPDGKYYFTDVSSRWDFLRTLYIIIERRPNGRLLSYDPIGGEIKVVAKGLSFPNGVELSHDKKSLLVPETSRYRVRRIYLGDRLGESEIILENLPGYPDNIRRHPDGGYLVGLSGMRKPDVDFSARYPQLRKILTKVLSYKRLIALSPFYGLCLHISEQGKILRSWHDPAGGYHHTSHCQIHDGHMFVGSFYGHGMLRVPL